MLLPVSSYKDQIVEAVQNNAFTIVSAETGSGKSTQIPQYLVKYFDRVVVTEPRIMAAKTLARRVSEEMGVTLGKEVGFRTAYEKCCSSESRILYCTDGLQLVRTIFGKDTLSGNVLIIDEVHDWNLNIEVLIAWCKHMHQKWNTKVVLMSATMDTASLADFFGNDVAVLNIPGNLYDVEVEERPRYQLVTTIKENIVAGKNILVFVPGKREIGEVMQELEKADATVLPLHGEMEWDDQKKVFESYPNSKVVVATNVAQTSITIPDIDVVVDTGEARISIAQDGIQGLSLKDISQADIFQRKGRAGRTKDGKYFLCSDTGINDREEFSVPEIQRSILDRVVLQLTEIGLDAETLEFFHQPSMREIRHSKKELEAIGALSGNYVTEIGHKIARIPVSVQLARMIIEAEKYGVTEPVLTIASIIEMGGILQKGNTYLSFTEEGKSDLLAELDVWKSINQMKFIDFNEIGIRKKAFFRIKDHIRRLKEALSGFVEMSSKDDRAAILKACLHGLVSNIYVKRGSLWYSYDGEEARLERKSCILPYSQLVVGIPTTIEYINIYGFKETFTLLRFATQIDVSVLYELVPHLVQEETQLRYSPLIDAVEVCVKKYFAGELIDLAVSYEGNHPEYSRLKDEYRQETISYEATPAFVGKGEVWIKGKRFQVQYSYLKKHYVAYIDPVTLFATDEKEVYMASGAKVFFFTDGMRREDSNLNGLRKAAEMNHIRQARESMKRDLANVKVHTVCDIIHNADKIGEICLTMNNGGYGDKPILVYGELVLKKNTVTIQLNDDEEVAKSNTRESLQFLFYKEIEKKYGESKFSHLPGKKKKTLTKLEMEAKNDFYSLVREFMESLTVENLQETLDFLEEYYQELMEQ